MSTTIAEPNAARAFLAGGVKKLLIGGEWVPAAAGGSIESMNPSTGEVIAHFAAGESEDVNRAVAAARRAFEGPWSRFTPAQRQDVLLRLADLVDQHFDELSYLDSVDMGGPISRTRGGRDRQVGMLRFYAGLAMTIHGDTLDVSIPPELGEFTTYTRKEPVGVVGGIIPWNGPLSQAIGKIAPVLATGCTIVLKPAEEAPLSPLRLGELIQEIGLPPGVVNIVTGYGETAGAALAAHPDVDKVAFTGSTFTGQEIVKASATNLKRLTMELGGKSPDVIFADADLDLAVPGASMGVFGNSGQVCCAGTRVFVQRPIYEEFIARAAEFSTTLAVGNSLDTGTQIGPIVSKVQLDRVTGYLDIGQREGATLKSGGTRLTDGEREAGYFVAPTVFADVRDDMRIAREEIFGPVMSVLPFDDAEGIIRRANDTNFGLGSGVWTRDVGKAHSFAKSVRAGVVWVNCYNMFDQAMPFGGYKMSGYGREFGMHHIDEYLNTKAVWIRTA